MINLFRTIDLPEDTKALELKWRWRIAGLKPGMEAWYDARWIFRFKDPHTWVPDMLGFIQKHPFHWTAFSFHPKAAPIIITGWDYKPSSHWDVCVKRALAGEKFEMKKMR